MRTIVLPRRATRAAASVQLVPRFLAATYLYAMLWLALAVPAVALVGGLQPLLIASGSMAPLIQAGDVVLVRPPGDRPYAPGAVLTFRRTTPGIERLVTHRVVATLEDGYLTKGDANASPDSDRVARSDVVGVARVVVPLVGLPVHWFGRGDWVALGLWAATTLLAVAVVGGGGTARPSPRPPLRAGGRAVPTRRNHPRPVPLSGTWPVPSRRLQSHAAAIVLVVLAAIGGSWLAPRAEAAWVGTTANPGNVLVATFWARVVSIAAGEAHTCVALGDGTAWCWGLNDKGQLGDGTTTDRWTPVQVRGPGGSGTLAGVRRLAAGDKHTCAALGSGAAYCWGQNNEGQLGDTTTTDRSTPVQVVGAGGTGTLASVERIAAGSLHSCATRSDGSAWCWGRNDRGQLGDNTTVDKEAPVQVRGPGAVGFLTGASRIAAAGKFACAVRTDGTAWCWGENNEGQLGDNTTTNRSTPVQVVGLLGIGTLTGAADVAAGSLHTCVSRTDGSMWCWGRNDRGQLGDGTTTDHEAPAPVLAPSGIGNLGAVAAPVAGSKHTCAISTAGAIWCWGQNDRGQVGDGTTTQRTLPVQVLGVGGSGTLSGVVVAAAGLVHTCAARTDDTVACWGRNDRGQLGTNSTTDSSVPVTVKGPGEIGTFKNVVSVAAGEGHTCVALSDGSAWCWGLNDKGQVGDNTTTDRATPTRVVGVGGTGWLAGVARVTAGQKHSCAVTTAGTMRCWGDNSKGELGDNTTTNRSAPVQVLGVGGVGTLSGVARAAAGLQHTCAVLSDGTVRCWGLNDKGQLGDGTTTQRTTAVQVRGVGGVGFLTGATRMAAGERHSCTAQSGGAARCWGDNGKGQLGDGTTSQRTTPVAVVGLGGVGALSGVVELRGGGQHTCSARSDGSAWCWGLNDKGQLGDATTTDRSTPAPVVGAGGVGLLAAVATIAAGDRHSCAAATDGSMRCWGLNDKGQLGDATTTDRSTPVSVVGPGGAGSFTGAVSAAGGSQHTCAVTTATTTWCWGRNDKGQLGIGTTSDSAIPVRVL